MKKWSFIGALSLMVIVLVLFIGVTSSPAGMVNYNKTMSFSLFPPGGALVRGVLARYSENTWVEDPNFRRAPGQPLPTPGLNAGQVFVPPTGTNSIWTAATFSGPGPNSAIAHSNIVVSSYPLAGPVEGSVNVNGAANAAPVFLGFRTSKAFAWSLSQVLVGGPGAFGAGGVVLRPVAMAAIPGGTGIVTPPTAGIVDPMFFEILDLDTGNIIDSGTLFDSLLIIHGRTSFSWDSVTSLLSVEAPPGSGNDVDFSLYLNDAYVQPAGSLNLQIRNGVVTLADDSGVFDGILPMVGSPGTFTTSLGEISFNYNLGDFTGRNVAINLDFQSWGSAYAVAVVPLPSSLPLFGYGVLIIWRYLKRNGVA